MAFKWFRRKSSHPAQVPVSTKDANTAVQTASQTPLPAETPADKPAAPTDAVDESPLATDQDEQPPARDREQSVISNDDEQLLAHIVSTAEDPILPPFDVDGSDDEGARPSLAEAAAAEVAKKTPLPSSPPPDIDRKKSNRYSWAAATDTLSRTFTFRRKPSQQGAAPAPAKPLDGKAVQGPPTEEEAKKEKKDLANVLQKLKLDSDSLQTRALSLSEDSRKMLNQFIQILKDIVSGAPHAYDDLDRFLKTREKQIEGLYDSLPPFLQKLVQALPTKAWQYLGPQVAAGVAAATSNDKTRAQAEQNRQKRSNRYVPNLKSLLANQGAVAAMLRSILEFLEARFPVALVGTNVLLSLAVFLLLFVFWYCYRRGKEERLVVEDEEKTRGRSRERSVDGKRDGDGDAVGGGKVDGAKEGVEETQDGDSQRMESAGMTTGKEDVEK
ncbi:MAG: hypothetical protein Q9162_002968 [Coniocarpon cinnabarinum]